MNVNPYHSERVNQNLIDNWYFGNPVNQRGSTTYSTAGYAIDRYFLETGTVAVVEGGVKFAGGTTVQRAEQHVFDAAKDHLLTLSALTADGKLYSHTAQWGSHNININGCELLTTTFVTEKQTFRMTSTATGVTLLAVKLEFGNQQTLAHQEGDKWVLNEIPDFTLERLKCQRFYFKSEKSYAAPGRYFNNEYLPLNVEFPVEMRIAPTVTIYDYSWNANYISDWSQGEKAVGDVCANGISVKGFTGIKATGDQKFNTNIVYAFNVEADANL